MATWDLHLRVETDEDPNDTEYTLAEIVEDGGAYLVSATRAGFPQTPEEATTCPHGNRVWFGHECGLCDEVPEVQMVRMVTGPDLTRQAYDTLGYPPPAPGTTYTQPDREVDYEVHYVFVVKAPHNASEGDITASVHDYISNADAPLDNPVLYKEV